MKRKVSFILASMLLIFVVVIPMKSEATINRKEYLYLGKSVNNKTDKQAKAKTLKYYAKYPSVPNLTNIKGVKRRNAPQFNWSKKGYVYNYKKTKMTTSELLSKYSKILKKEGFKYSSKESHYTELEEYKNDKLVKSEKHLDKIVYYDKTNNLKIVAEYDSVFYNRIKADSFIVVTISSSIETSSDTYNDSYQVLTPEIAIEFYNNSK